METGDIIRIKIMTMQWVKKEINRYHFPDDKIYLKESIENLVFDRENDVLCCYKKFIQQFDNNIFNLLYRIKSNKVCCECTKGYFVKYKIGNDVIYIPFKIYLDKENGKRTPDNRWNELIGKLEADAQTEALQYTGKYAMACQTFLDERRNFFAEYRQEFVDVFAESLEKYSDLNKAIDYRGEHGLYVLSMIICIIAAMGLYCLGIYLYEKLLKSFAAIFVPMVIFTFLGVGISFLFKRFRLEKKRKKHMLSVQKVVEGDQAAEKEEIEKMLAAVNTFWDWEKEQKGFRFRDWVKCVKAYHVSVKERYLLSEIKGKLLRELDNLHKEKRETGKAGEISEMFWPGSVFIVVGTLLLISLFIRLGIGNEKKNVCETEVIASGESSEQPQTNAEDKNDLQEGINGTYKVAEGIQLRVRSGPGQYYPEVGLYENGESVTVLDAKENEKALWFKIEYEGKENAWVNRKWLKRIYPGEVEISSIVALNGAKDNLDMLHQGYLSKAAFFSVDDILSGNGVEVLIMLAQKAKIKSLIIYTGNYKDFEFDLYGKISKVTVDFGDGEEIPYDIDTCLNFEGCTIPAKEPIETSMITIRLLDIEEGEMYKNIACLEEIIVLQEN